MARNWTKFWTKLGSANLIVEELNPKSNWLALVGPNAQLCWTTPSALWRPGWPG